MSALQRSRAKLRFTNLFIIHFFKNKGIAGLCITILQTVNLIICHRNFGNNLGFYRK